MKVLAVSGSARKDGNTAMLVRYVFEELEKEGIGTELVQLAGERVRGRCMDTIWQFTIRSRAQARVRDD